MRVRVVFARASHCLMSWQTSLRWPAQHGRTTAHGSWAVSPYRFLDMVELYSGSQRLSTQVAQAWWGGGASKHASSGISNVWNSILVQTCCLQKSTQSVFLVLCASPFGFLGLRCGIEKDRRTEHMYVDLPA